ncbi:MAG: 1,2-phenylacetyl-CoA epoxidase subunit B [Bacteroidetes bacterium]|nr:1,2-phenylacetyl-CoA epoxidase subunit B [Bacteroidota bacterium]
MNKSLDPRMGRIALIEDAVELPEMDNWETWEVFHQKKRGDQHIHVGIVHAPNADMALVMAKEAFGRRGITANLWVVKSSNIVATPYEDMDMFETTPEKQYREAGGYKVMDKINKYKKEHSQK